MATKQPSPPSPASPSAPFQRPLTERQLELLARFERQPHAKGSGFFYAGGAQIADWATVKKVFVTLGGKWVSRPGCFVFEDAEAGAAKVALALATGEILDPRVAGYFPTPPRLADRMVALLGVKPGQRVLEPSAGRGALAIPARAAGGEVTCVEPLEDNAAFLRAAGFDVRQTPFQWVSFLGFDRVIMNPPFGSDELGDVGHVFRALQALHQGRDRDKPRLVAILSAGARTRQTKRHSELHGYLGSGDWNVTWDDLPDDTFAASNTRVRTVLLTAVRQ